MQTQQKTKMTRTDIHRVGAIIPADYRFVVFYALPTTDNGWPVPSYNIDRVVELRRTEKFSAHGSTGKCTVCGASFIEGSIWKHVPTSEHIHIGHQCADKYELRVDWSPLELARERQRIQAQREATAERNRTYEARQLARANEYLDTKPHLREALAVDHRIIKDIRERFFQYASISPKQEELVLRLAAEARSPKVEERHVPHPTGRVTFRGRVVGIKTIDDDFSRTQKATIKIETPAGSWLCWLTIPNTIYGNVERGDEVVVTATLQPGRDAHFCFGKRPKMEVVDKAAAMAEARGRSR